MVMQHKNDQYDPSQHDRWRALTVKQPYATDLVTPAYTHDGKEYAVKSIEVRSKNAKYRGDVMICSAGTPEIHGLESGVCVGLVELYDVKKCSEFTAEDWENTRIPESERGKHKKSFGWLMRNPRRVVEFPVKGQLGLFHLVYTKDTITEYPRVVLMDKGSYRIATQVKSNVSLKNK